MTMGAIQDRLSQLAMEGKLLTPTGPDFELKGVWTRFFDMHSGGFGKEPWSVILIEAPMGMAEKVFASIFGHSPGHVTCNCCGSDYSKWEVNMEDKDELNNALANVPECSVLFIKASDILDEWKPHET